MTAREGDDALLDSSNDMSNDIFRQYSAYYDLLYRDKDYPSEAGYVMRTLHAADPDVRTVLEFGSGTGRHGRLLAEYGLDVFGVERSDAMVAVARDAQATGVTEGGGRFGCVQGDIRTADIGRSFDAVISLFHVVSYQTDNDDLRRTFASAARHVRPRGVFFFDVWHGPAVLSQRPAVRVKRVEDDDTRLWRIAEPDLDLDAGVVTVRYTVLAESKLHGNLTRFEEVHRMRYLFPTDIEFLAEPVGFRIERTEEFLTGAPVSDRTWGVAYVLRKQG